MISVTGILQHEAWARRELPPVERLDGGIWSLPVPIPDSPLRYTLSYLVPGTGGAVVVDPGWDSPEGWAALTAGLAAAGHTAADVVGVVVTHVHPDHHGLSGRLRDESGAWVAMHPMERDTLPARTLGENPRERAARWLRTHHVPDEEIDAMLAHMPGVGTPMRAPLVEPDVLLEDGDDVPLPGRTLRALWTPGHTPGHLCLVEPDAGVLLTGDHVLPRISPNIGVQPTVDDPLAAFLQSLERVADLDDLDALPAHEYRFRGIKARAAALREHHAERCREIVGVVRALGAPSMWTLAAHLTWSRPWEEIGRMRIAAVSETAAHVEYLVARGELVTSGRPATVCLPAGTG